MLIYNSCKVNVDLFVGYRNNNCLLTLLISCHQRLNRVCFMKVKVVRSKKIFLKKYERFCVRPLFTWLITLYFVGIAFHSGINQI